MTTTDTPLAELVAAARDGDQQAWNELVRRLEPAMRRTARSYRLQASDVDDVVQRTWLRLFRSLDGIRDPAFIFAWLDTTTRREALRLLQRPVREVLTEDELFDRADERDDPLTTVIDRERRAVLGRAIATLPRRHRTLLTVLAEASTPDYRRISASLGIPVGSIGPTRSRGLARLREAPRGARAAGVKARAGTNTSIEGVRSQPRAQTRGVP